ncbi:hypothetical protein AB9B48_14800 [Kluyvera ascorbata]|uniref:hypothetical protein n=1 Tax=Kluyvera ascorbata TaxID=51288 RepID=UPI00350F2A14
MNNREQFETWFKSKFHLADEHLNEGDYGSDTPALKRMGWPKTPATDSAIANIQAQGVEMFAERKRNEMMSLHPDTHAVGSIAAAMSAEVKELREFAAQLRQGAEQ